MKHSKTLLILLSLVFPFLSLHAQVAHFDMAPSDGQIVEKVEGKHYKVNSVLPVVGATGINGEALRFDGFSNYVRASLPSGLNAEHFTLNVLLAAETYPMMVTDVAEASPSYATVCGNLDVNQISGFSLMLSSQGDIRVRYASTFAGGRVLPVNGNKKLPRGQWNLVSFVYDSSSDVPAKLFLNGQQIGLGTFAGKMKHGTSDFYIGKDSTEQKQDGFLLNTFCGLIDDITIYNDVVMPKDFATATTPDFNYPAQRYEGSLWRPEFHAMPSGSWTNETHGMIYSNGRYHVFFQKNANGPYMSRLHWGHVSSPNLYQWTEELIAIYPGESYDMKGCWSGCVYETSSTNSEGGKPQHRILYTAVDNQKARIVAANATDDGLIHWEKEGIIIDGRPTGLSDDFRDPYHFTANGQEYIIVGTSKGGIGACTLHRLQNGTWTNDGSIFFKGTNVAQDGTFWEMPTMTEMADGKWLFTCTPLNTGNGVRTLCYVGTVGNNGQFTPDTNTPQYLEMGGISRQGYGLLSPTIYQKDGKTLMLGIVPDKLPTEVNRQMGWAHLYSLPRELSLDANGRLVQKPYSGLTAMRTETKAECNQTLLGEYSLSPVSGRHLELFGEFKISTGQVGFHFLKSGDKQASVAYNPADGTLTLDLSKLDRTVNDNGSFNGIYRCTLPEKPADGTNLKLNVFVDGSILDIFVNDRWGFSVRLFPTGADQIDVEAFATAPTDVNIKAWVLDANSASNIESLSYNHSLRNEEGIYTLGGQRMSRVPQTGVFIRNGKKYVR